MGAAAMTGLGNSSPSLLGNGGELTPLIERMFDDAVATFPLMRDTGGLDFEIDDDYIKFGIEPSYMYEHLEIVCLQRNAMNSYRERGVAWGGWGSGLAKTRKYRSEFKNSSRFTRFVDKWCPILFP